MNVVEKTTPNTRTQRRCLASTSLLLLLLGASGCGSGQNISPQEAAPVNQGQYDSQIQSIQNNRNMTPEAKARAIADIKARSAAQQGAK